MRRENIDLDHVSEILLENVWYRVVPGTFDVGRYDFRNRKGVQANDIGRAVFTAGLDWFSFQEENHTREMLYGPLAAIRGLRTADRPADD